MDRKEFIKNCGFACLGAIGISTFLEGCTATSYFAKNTIADHNLMVAKTEFENEKKEFRKYVLLKHPQLIFPICIFRFSENEFSALSMECTHSSCELQNQGDFLMCPCHGSEFSNKGIVQNPPAEQNLKSYNITIKNELLYIQL